MEELPVAARLAPLGAEAPREDEGPKKEYPGLWTALGQMKRQVASHFRRERCRELPL